MIYWLTYQIKLHQKIEAEIKKDNNEDWYSSHSLIRL
jgi:hypothetical protein